MAKTKYDWRLMPEKLFQERGDFDKNRYVIKGNEIAQMEKNQQTEYNNMLRRMKEGADNLRLEGAHELMEMKIANFYKKANEDRDLNEFIKGSNAALQLITTGAGIWKEGELAKKTKDLQNPENRAIAVKGAKIYFDKYIELMKEHGKSAKVIGLLKSDPQTQPFAKLIEGKSSVRLAALIEELALDKMVNIDKVTKHLQSTLKNEDGKTLNQLTVNSAEYMALTAKIDAAALRFASFIGTAGDKVMLPSALQTSHLQPKIRQLRQNSTMTELAKQEDQKYDRQWEYNKNIAKSIIKSVQLADGSGVPEELTAVGKLNWAAQVEVDKGNYDNLRDAKRGILESMQSIIRNDEFGEDAHWVRHFTQQLVEESDSPNAQKVPLSERMGTLLGDGALGTGLLKTVEDSIANYETRRKEQATKDATTFRTLVRKPGETLTQPELLNRQAAWVKTPQGEFALQVLGPQGLDTLLSEGVSTVKEDQQDKVEWTLRQRAKSDANGGQINKEVAIEEGASDALINKLTEEGIIRKVELPITETQLNGYVDATAKHIIGKIGEEFKGNPDGALAKIGVSEYINQRFDELAPSIGADRAWKQITRELTTDQVKNQILAGSVPIVDVSDAQRGINVGMDHRAKAGTTPQERLAYAQNTVIKDIQPRLLEYMDRMEKFATPGQVREMLKRDLYLNNVARKMGITVEELMDGQLRLNGISGGLPDRGENYPEEAIVAGDNLEKYLSSVEGIRYHNSKRYQPGTLQALSNLGVLSIGAGKHKSNLVKYNRNLSDIHKDNEAFDVGVFNLNTEDGQTQINDYLEAQGFNTQTLTQPSLLESMAGLYAKAGTGYNLDNMHPRLKSILPLLNASYQIDNQSEEGDNFLSQIARSSHRSMTQSRGKYIEFEVPSDSSALTWLSSPAADGSGRTNADMYNLTLETRKGHTGHIVRYTGPTNTIDLTMNGAAKRANTDGDPAYTPLHRFKYMGDAFEQNPLLVRYGGNEKDPGKSFFELPVRSDNPEDITQQSVLNIWFQTTGRYRQNSIFGGNQ